MSKFVIRENDGRFHLEDFGPRFAGPEGGDRFALVIEAPSTGLYVEFPDATVHDLFTRFDFSDPAYQANRYSCRDFLRVHEEHGEYLVEVRTGSLYDFLRECLAAGRYRLQGEGRVGITWPGASEAA
jgi:hypothetical protein